MRLLSQHIIFRVIPGGYQSGWFSRYTRDGWPSRAGELRSPFPFAQHEITQPLYDANRKGEILYLENLPYEFFSDFAKLYPKPKR